MTTIVIRSQNEDLDPDNPLHRMQLSIPWPEGAVSAERMTPRDPWKFTTKADVLRCKRERIEQRLWFKREYGVVKRVPLYVWVFWCPGINDFFYKGWWVELIGRAIEYGKYLGGNEKMMARIMELFPLVEPSLFVTHAEEWKQEFVKRYRRGIWCGKPQGKSPVWAEVRHGNIDRLLERAEWPR